MCRFGGKVGRGEREVHSNIMAVNDDSDRKRPVLMVV